MFNTNGQSAASLPNRSPSLQATGSDIQVNEIGAAPNSASIKAAAPTAFLRRQWRKRRVGRYASS